MSCYVHGKRMPDWYKPELYDEQDLQDFVKEIYENCRCYERGCDDCKYNGELDGESCKVDIIMELWRRWENLKHAHAPKLESRSSL